MKLIKTNFKRKCTKRKCTKRKCTKRKCTKRKSNKYGGTITNNPQDAADKRKQILNIIENCLGVDDYNESDYDSFFAVLENSEDEFNLDDVLQQLRNAITTGRNNNRGKNKKNTDMTSIFTFLTELSKKAEKATKSKPPNETQREVTNVGCPSQGIEPVDCTDRSHYLRQTLIFHPDKNPDCPTDATTKFQALQNNPRCSSFK
jgi:hypothetical protein